MKNGSVRAVVNEPLTSILTYLTEEGWQVIWIAVDLAGAGAGEAGDLGFP